jgi:hypothetical protein
VESLSFQIYLVQKMQTSEIEVRKKIVHKFNENPNGSGRSIGKELKLPQRTVSNVIKRYKNTLTIERAPQTGRKAVPVDKELSKRVMKSLMNNPGLSIRDQGKKFRTSKTNIQKIRSRHGFRSYRAVRQPNRSDKQNLVAKQRARKLYDRLLTFNGCWIMDDETQVKTDFRQIRGGKWYSSKLRGRVPDKFKFVLEDKYAKKVMIWQAICSCGLKSKPFATSSILTSDIYIKECLQKRLLPMVRSHNIPVVFWPDLASIHYAKKTLEWFNTNQVAVIPKDINPPNCPKLRPIEEYWSIIKQMLCKNGGGVSNKAQMCTKWNYFAEKVAPALVHKLMGAIKSRVRKFIRSEDE